MFTWLTCYQLTIHFLFSLNQVYRLCEPYQSLWIRLVPIWSLLFPSSPQPCVGHRVIRNMFEFQNFCINMMIIQKFWNSNIFLITLWPVTNQWLVTLHDLHVSMYFLFILNLVYRLYETLKSSFSCPSVFYWILIFWSQSDWEYLLIG